MTLFKYQGEIGLLLTISGIFYLMFSGFFSFYNLLIDIFIILLINIGIVLLILWDGE